MQAKKQLSKKDYDRYMKRIDEYIKNAERMINELPKFRELRNLSLEKWLILQKAELKK